MNTNKTNPQKMLFFDTETTGLHPGNICQLSYIIIDKDDIKSNNYFFKVDYVEHGAEQVHGLSVEKLLKLSNDKSFKDYFFSLKDDFDSADLLIGHNISFDLKFIMSEYKRSGYNFIYNDSLCTMKYFTNTCKIQNSRGYGYKWPKLEELTNFLNINNKEIVKTTEDIFGSAGIGFHDARFDTVATYLSYMKGLKEGLDYFVLMTPVLLP